MEQDVKGKIVAWVVLPNHYHLVADVDLALFGPWTGRLHNGKSTQWNREDNSLGRKVWYRCSDRKIRGEGHYYASLNYLHFNPVKHKYVEEAGDWPWSSLHTYLETVGREKLNEWWRKYPIRKYGKGWDD
ncbi:MAG: transposase [bacterium]